jgi:hypothetical protein
VLQTLQVFLASSGSAKATFPLYFTYMPVWPARQSKTGFFSRILFAPACIFLPDKRLCRAKKPMRRQWLESSPVTRNSGSHQGRFPIDDRYRRQYACPVSSDWVSGSALAAKKR